MTGESDIPTGLNFVEAPSAPETINTLLYGPPGSGKSTAAATAPGPIMWLNAEGPNALAFARKIARDRGTTIFEVRLEKHADPRPQMREVIRHLRKGIEPQVQTVVVDTLAKVRELLIAVMVVQGSKNSRQQFGDVAKALGNFVSEIRDLPVNLVLIAHEDIKDEDGERIVRPLIGGMLTDSIPSEVDVLAYTAAVRDGDEVSYRGQLVEGRGRRAKDRSGGLGAVRDLDLTEWLAAFRQALDGDLLCERAEGDGDSAVISAEQRRAVLLKSNTAGLDRAELANVIKAVVGQEPALFESEDEASAWVNRNLEKLPARFVGPLMASLDAQKAAA